MVKLILLAIAWACKKTFTQGLEFTIVTDHKPLIPILSNYSLAKIENKHLQRLQMKIDQLSYRIQWIKCADTKEADALSRAPSSQLTDSDELDKPQDELTGIINCIIIDPAAKPVREINAIFGDDKNDSIIHEKIVKTDISFDPLVCQILEAGKADEANQKLRGWIRNGFPEPHSVDVKFDPLIHEQDQFQLDNDLILYQTPEATASAPRIFVPESFCR